MDTGTAAARGSIELTAGESGRGGAQGIGKPNDRSGGQRNRGAGLEIFEVTRIHVGEFGQVLGGHPEFRLAMVNPASEVTGGGGNRAHCHFSDPVVFPISTFSRPLTRLASEGRSGVVMTVVHGATMAKLTEVRDCFAPAPHLSFQSEVD
jgi:hypothetical protein